MEHHHCHCVCHREALKARRSGAQGWDIGGKGADEITRDVVISHDVGTFTVVREGNANADLGGRSPDDLSEMPGSQGEARCIVIVRGDLAVPAVRRGIT